MILLWCPQGDLNPCCRRERRVTGFRKHSQIAWNYYRYWHCAKTVESVLGWFFPYLGTFFRENHPKHHPSIKPSYDTNRAGFLLNTPFWILHFWIVTKFSRISLKNGLGRGSETDRPSSKATNSEIVKALIVPIYPFTTGGRYHNILWRLYGRKNHYPWIFWYAICSFLTFQTKARYDAGLVMLWV